MTITITDCENLVLDSPWLVEWKNDYPNHDFNLTLRQSLNGGTTEEIMITVDKLLEVSPYSYLATVEQGVYSWTLVKTDILTGDKEEDFLCYFNECDLNCELAENLSMGCATTHRLLTFLRAINDCNVCDCKYANIAYNLLLKQTKVTPINNTTNDCGCN